MSTLHARLQTSMPPELIACCVLCGVWCVGCAVYCVLGDVRVGMSLVGLIPSAHACVCLAILGRAHVCFATPFCSFCSQFICHARFVKERRVKVNIVRDDYLTGGTKQRALDVCMTGTDATEVVYAGPSEGYAQIALAHVAKFFNKRATVFLAERYDRCLHPLTQRAKKLGAKIVVEPRGTRITRLEEASERQVHRRSALHQQLRPMVAQTPRARIQTRTRTFKSSCSRNFVPMPIPCAAVLLT